MLAVRQCTFVELKVLVYSYLHLPATRHQKEKTVIVFSILEHLLNKGVRFLRNPTLHISYSSWVEEKMKKIDCLYDY